ncbi:hypothetical protein STPL106120_06500 [Streptococcus pluranimalium]|uniref:Crp/Fnr family transcriptional regulator n=1 Tax=Streptococcus pluranimalium TaxID=82348 RepID=UPI0039EC91F4
MKLLLLEQIIQYSKVAEMLANCPLTIINTIKLLEYREAGEFHLSQGSSYDYVYIILEGEFYISLIDQHSNRSVLLAVYNQSGMLIGEQEAILKVPYSATVRSTSPCKLLQISREDFNRWLRLDHDFSLYLLKNQCQQVYDLSGQVGYHTLYNAKEQIAQFLVKKYHSATIITKQDVHKSVAISSRHTNRILLDLQKKGLIIIHNTRIEVIDLEKLVYYGEEYHD